MVRIHDALDAATLAYGTTSGAAQQDETINQHAFDQQLDEISPELDEPSGAGPAHSIASDEVADVVNQQPDLKLVVISNRIAPSTPTNPRPEGLAAALEPVVERSGAVWVGSSENRGDGTEQPLPLVPTGTGQVARLDLPAADYPGYYRGFSNSTLWPALHSLPDRMSGSDEDYGSYQRTNGFIARAVFDLRDRDVFWVHDYHLLPLGANLHELGIERPTGFFLHTPWPSPDMIERVPNHRELMKSMLKYDLLGFQTNRDLNNFLSGLQTHFGLESKDGIVTTQRGQTRLQKFPIGIDPTQFAAYLAADLSPAEQEKVSSLLQDFEGAKFAIGVDRLDYTKGIDKRVEAFNQVLAAEPPRSISLLQIAPSSRADVEEYKKYKDDLERAINDVNNEHGTEEWRPIHYKNDSFSQAALARLYRAADVGVVTPLRDGMNLVAKEYVAAQDPKDPGVLVLSKFAGAAEDFNENEALLVDPNHPEEIAAAISKATHMPLEERVTRWRSMMDKIESYTIHDWSADYVRELDKSRVTVPADQFYHLGLGWTNEAQLPLYQDHAEALSAYNEIGPADAALKEPAYAGVKSSFEALAAPLMHTQDRLWVLPAPDSFA
ncbi:trehalose-6-phosphate synthase [Bradyrhizobium sp. CCBAU 51753]|uniref:alpha,alpha-trehalose-phosphate synthase (UDP-forming) n=1 Tax=Bradyrhizobium sp. CCBAU 51753 TaxID=1325100 RepID=UPI00188A7178|nr:trehalose-6-phosphate synthase [Bradyrhizobium sp. CCBAU 51753]QOZ23993.1 trehalose-6-phosphate synthase [Bradyrhizobium sp. CCBAU 51753]